MTGHDEGRIDAALLAAYDSMRYDPNVWHKALATAIPRALTAADAADFAAHIVRVDTRDEATVEKIARALALANYPNPCQWYVNDARAVLAALRGES